MLDNLGYPRYLSIVANFNLININLAVKWLEHVLKLETIKEKTHEKAVNDSSALTIGLKSGWYKSLPLLVIINEYPFTPSRYGGTDFSISLIGTSVPATPSKFAIRI